MTASNKTRNYTAQVTPKTYYGLFGVDVALAAVALRVLVALFGAGPCGRSCTLESI